MVCKLRSYLCVFGCLLVERNCAIGKRLCLISQGIHSFPACPPFLLEILPAQLCVVCVRRDLSVRAEEGQLGAVEGELRGQLRGQLRGS